MSPTPRDCPDRISLGAAFSNADEAVRPHLERCPRCAGEWRALERLRGLARGLPTEAPAAAQREEVRSGLLAAAQMQAPHPAQRGRARPTLIVAAVLAVAAAVTIAVWPRHRSGSPAQAIEVHRGVVRPVGAAKYNIVSAAPDEVVRLSEGTIRIEVAHLAAGERFRVVTGDAEVEVRGTAFEVIARDGNLASVHVVRGRVEVRPAAGANALLVAGQSWRAPVAAASTATARQVPPATVVDPPPNIGARAARPPRGALAAEPTARREPAPLAAEQDLETRVVPKAFEEAFEEGWAALRSGDPRRAADSFARARRAAADAPLAEDASFWEGVALARAGQRRDALSKLEAFVGRYPRSPRRGEVTVLIGQLLVEEGRLDEAETSFRTALDDVSAMVRSRARAGLDQVTARRRALSPR